MYNSMFYRPWDNDALNSLTEHLSLSFADPSRSKYVSNLNVGCLGLEHFISLLSMRIMSAIVGRSLGCSWTQRRPTCRHRGISSGENELINVPSIKSNPLCSLHNFHACNISYTWVLLSQGSRHQYISENWSKTAASNKECVLT